MQIVLEAAESLAADLAGARVDPNEAQKALAYLRSKKNPKLFFDYLRAINQKGPQILGGVPVLILPMACPGLQDTTYTLKERGIWMPFLT